VIFSCDHGFVNSFEHLEEGSLEAYTAWIWERAIERLLIVLFSGGALILGWNLFKTGIVLAQSAEFQGKGWTAKMLNVGPGIFFALFGTVSLVVASLRPFTIESTVFKPEDAQSKSKPPLIRRTSYGTGEIEYTSLVGPDEMRSINTVSFVIDAVQGRIKLSDSDSADLKRAIGYLESMKRRAIFQQYPALKDRFDELDQKVREQPNFLNSLSDSDRKTFLAVKGLMEANLNTPTKNR
jgi:hypothetical protein